MKNIKIGFWKTPDDISKFSKWASDQLREAFKMALQPAPVPEALITRRTVSLPDHVALQLEQAATAASMSPAILAAGLFHALHTHNESTDTPSDNNADESLDLDKIKPQLRKLTTLAKADMDTGKISFIEASTGSGKGRMIAALAIDALANGHTTVISAPLSVCRQLIHDLREIDNNCFPLIVLGRVNFINPIRVQDWIDEAKAEGQDEAGLQALQRWLDTGCPPVTEATVSLKDTTAFDRIAFLRDDAESLAPEYANVADWSLTDGDDLNDGELIYQELRGLIKQSEGRIIICSHHLLAADVKAGKIHSASILPDTIGRLIIDEAHMLESAFASVFSQTIHLHAINHWTRESDLSVADKRLISSCGEGLQDGAMASLMDDRAFGRASDLPALRIHAERFSNAVASAKLKKRKRTKNGKRGFYKIEQLANNLDAFLNHGSSALITHTQVRQYPLLTIGRSNLEFAFKALWLKAAGCSLVSATLYLPEATGNYSANHIRWSLAVPKERAAYHQPVKPEWVTRTPLLQLVQSGLAPTSNEDDEGDAWHDQTTLQIQQISAQSKGGILVLCTSYQTASALGKRLKDSHGDQLVVQDGSTSIARCKQRFMALHQSGVKPIWLGVGNAWTGLDLTVKGTAPADDTLLTDLFIPRLPFGTNHSMTHYRRKLAMKSIQVEVNEVARQFRQGIGRLVRREGLQHRKIWIADNRITTEPVKPMYRMLRRILDDYPQRRTTHAPGAA